MTTLHLLVPAGVDDPLRPSGGNHYDLRLSDELRRLGWEVRLVHDPGAIPDAALTLVDGLVVDRVREHVHRLRVVLLLHTPYDGPVLGTARGVIATSAWTADHLSVPAHVARPGVDPAAVSRWSPTGGRLLCVGPLVPDKGHDVLLEALDKLDDLEWRLVCVGNRDRDPQWAAAFRSDARVVFTGPRNRPELAARYAAADLLVLPTRRESYGMVVSEAQSRGIPVVASDVGGVPEALAEGGGLLVPPDDPGALAAALRRWLEDPHLRDLLRARSRRRRETLTGWDATAREVDAALAGVSP